MNFAPSKLLALAGLAAVGYATMSNKKSISQHGLNLLKQLEGYSATPYRDADGFSIGYGHYIKPGEDYRYLTKPEAERLLRDDVATAENVVNNLVTVQLSQNMFDSLVLFVYNVGTGNFMESTLLRVLNDGDYIEAQAQFARWNKSRVNGVLKVNDGLIARRAREAELFFT